MDNKQIARLDRKVEMLLTGFRLYGGNVSMEDQGTDDPSPPTFIQAYWPV